MGGSGSLTFKLSSGSGLCDQVEPNSARETRSVGADPTESVVLMEDHDEAYYAWKQAGIQGRILLHIDAHIDWNWIADKDPRALLEAQSLTQVQSMLEEQGLWNLTERTPDELVHVGNYVYPVLKEGIVREFYWIVPDSFMESPAARRKLVRQFHTLERINPRAVKTVKVTDDRMVAEINNTKVTACTLSHLPEIREPVLLDIDTDFLLTEPVESARAGHDLWKQLPGIWPEELVTRLKDKGVRTDFVTIAYSVEGGFTPLPYKYLGDELAVRLKHPALPEHHRELLAHKRRAAHFRSRNELDQAITEFEHAMDLAPEDASTHFNLAYLYDEKTAYDQAAARYRQALELDPTYATAYNNFGYVYRSLGLLEKAIKEYQRMLRWDPQNADAQYGLAEILAQREQWDEAITHYQTVMEFRPDHLGAHQGLGYVYAQCGRWEEAISQLDRSIAIKPHDGFARFWLGEAHFHQQRWKEALEAYRAALRGGIRDVTIYRRLGSLYLRKRKLYKAFTQYRKALRLQGWLALFRLRGVWRTLSYALARDSAFEERDDSLAAHRG